ncbi:hypothetical protein [Candidatus Nitrospira neomarina]|uniref:Uncharacterized protein n=1 Tax=Candidatus Nitrospira neomarina TaxID=3020899 RepID=A0AA96JWI2_9BACT|nr:hypothetical protein [Candidatus Nitrospira neomarina]WNM62085.1 hypothetical protein PQG83_20450 [Candidatus Nitrospira neomarina]
MKKILLIGVLVLVGVSLAYCQHFWFPYTWHQKMTLEVDVDGQFYTGSSVVKVTVRDSDPLTKGLGFSSQFGARGEAAFVELPEGKVLFALLDGGPPDSGPQTNAINIFKDQLPRRGDERFAIVAKSRFRKDIPRSHYPLLVTFTDISDPTTVKVVDPDNLAETFWPGVSLKRITLEITDEPVTEGKVEQFRFLKVLKRQGTLSGLVIADKDHPEPINYITSKAFKIGGEK